MYDIVATKLSIPAGATAYSRAVSMAGANAIQVDVTCYVAPGGSGLAVKAEGSNDMENWMLTASVLSPSITFTTTQGYAAASAAGLAFAYVRLVFINAGSSAAVVGAGIRTEDL